MKAQTECRSHRMGGLWGLGDISEGSEVLFETTPTGVAGCRAVGSNEVILHKDLGSKRSLYTPRY